MYRMQEYRIGFYEEGKLFVISKHQVFKAYKCVRANKGAGGIDGIEFEK
jgi:RNA-directed DNA polymerase